MYIPSGTFFGRVKTGGRILRQSLDTDVFSTAKLRLADFIKVKCLGVKPKELKLPEPSHFEALLRTMESAGARQSQHCADLVRFLAFSGCRLSEARLVTWADWAR